MAVVEETLSYNSTAINGRQIEQAEPSDGPFAQGWQQARGTPRRVPPTHATNPGPGYLERLPVGRPSGDGLSLNIVIPLWTPLAPNSGTFEPGLVKLYAETFDV